jgi:hypothetical protein
MRQKIEFDTRNFPAIIQMIHDKVRIELKRPTAQRKGKNATDSRSSTEALTMFGGRDIDALEILCFIALHVEIERCLNEWDDLPDFVNLTVDVDGGTKTIRMDRGAFGQWRDAFPDDLERVASATRSILDPVSDFARMKVLFRLTTLEYQIQRVRDSVREVLIARDESLSGPSDSDSRKLNLLRALETQCPLLDQELRGHFVEDYLADDLWVSEGRRNPNAVKKLHREDEVKILRILGWIRDDNFNGTKLTRVLTDIRSEDAQGSPIKVLKVESGVFPIG